MVNLSESEALELAQLEKEESQGLFSPPTNMALSKNEEMELAQLEREESEGLFSTPSMPTNNGREADLGTLNRLQYSVEPLESNRKAFLTQQFGVENVKEDADGETYLRQNGEWRPVNKDGLSLADGADILGATPEMIGGAVAGFAGAVTTGGLGAIPSAMIGAGAGSALRQGASALLGTPQVANPIERVSEIALSTGMGAAGAAGGKALKAVGGKTIKTIKKAFPKLKVSVDGEKLLKIAEKEGLPKPTPGQMAGGHDLKMEKALGHRKFFGRKVRKRMEEQTEAIKSNIANKFGDFVDTESKRSEVGYSLKNRAKEYINGVKEKSGDLFNEVAEESKDIGIDAKEFKDSLVKQFQKLGVFDYQGKPIAHTSRTGMTEDAFNKTQNIFGKLLKDIDNSGTDLIDGTIMNGQKGQYLDANTINTMRKFINSNIKEQGYGFDDVLLMKLQNNFMDVSESMLESKNPALKEKFKLARALWSEQLTLNKQFKKGGVNGLGISDLSDEKVIDRIFNNKKTVKILKSMTDKESAEKAGITYVNNILSKKGGGVDQKVANSALNTFKEKREALIEAFGREKYDTLVNNLHYMNRIGESINPSETKIVDLMTSLNPFNIAAGAFESVQHKARGASKNFIKSAEKFNKRLPNRVRKAAIGLSDSSQREASYLTRGPNRAPQNKEKEK